ncbi:MAG: HD domain-containing protein [Chloroflexota bacterium]|nr:HD domain-containing protein [Chloroflexota bacterium]
MKKRDLLYKSSDISSVDEAAFLHELKSIVTTNNVTGYIVGGAVRDMLLGYVPQDIDMAVSISAPDMAQRMIDIIGGTAVSLGGEDGVVRVVVDDRWSSNGDFQKYCDITTIRGDIESDLGQRDFTIDAMAISIDKDWGMGWGDCLTSDIIDPFGGKSDLSNRLIRAVADDIFESDPCRLLRAVRLAAEYDFTVENHTEDLIRIQGRMLEKVAGERIREELCRLLNVPRATEYLRCLDLLCLFNVIFPELIICKGVDQPKEHFWDVFDHSMETVFAVEGLLQMDQSIYGRSLPIDGSLSTVLQNIRGRVGDTNRIVLLKLAALLHDVAKPQTKNIEKDGRTHFFGHAKEGALMARDVLKRLRFGGQQIRLVESMIEHHLRLWQMSNIGLPTRRAIYRYFRDTTDASFDIIVLSLADYIASQGPNLDVEEWNRHCELMGYIATEYQKGDDIVSPPKLVNGHDLIKTFDLEPGPDIGRILEAIREAQAAGEINTKEQALVFAKEQLKA